MATLKLQTTQVEKRTTAESSAWLWTISRRSCVSSSICLSA